HTGNWDKLHQRLGWKPEVSWKEGLKRTIDWYRDNPEWWQKQMWMRTVPIVTAEGKVEWH
ncbi:epimerase, partial [Magnetococcales bacterium HHB-1]